MAISRVTKFALTIAVVIAVIGVWSLCVQFMMHTVGTPKREKLADCTSDRLSFPLKVRDRHSNYHLVLGLPRAATEPLSFRGEVQVSQSTGLVTRILISSDNTTPCNWLDSAGLAGYILTWSSRTNRGERFDDFLVRGQSYHVQVAFSNSPPRGSSLWISSLGRLGEP